MPDPREQLAHAALMEALDVPANDRDAFLRRRCEGDPSLLVRARRLLEAVDRSTGFLETPALAESASDSPHLRVPGYHGLRLLASGGMATVYQAIQDRPERPVALKILRRGLSESTARRFQFETEVLARLQHPGIARIYEAGTCEDQVGCTYPFFAMEMVEDARPIVEYCRQNKLPLAQVLTLFAEVCDAVQYGHQFGVIHRDLKSANILVDGLGHPKVIDFGIARSAQRAEESLTSEMDSGAILGTLNTMSPEQCAGSADLDIRTDVYSLGVVLYQLVAGRFPHELNRVPIPEAIRLIAHEEPKSPSVYNPEARGDVDAIIVKALEKDRLRRYANAGELAADLRRHLDCRPIEATPATTLYQARKFAARNKGLTAAMSVAGVAMLVAAAVLIFAAVHAARSRDEAIAREKELESVLAFQEAQLSGIDVRGMGTRMRSDLAAAVAKSGTKGASPKLFDGVNFTDLARKTLDETILERTREAIGQQFAEKPLVRARLLFRLAATMNSLGLQRRAEPNLREALKIQEEQLGRDAHDTLLTMHALGSLLSHLGQFDESISLLKEVRERRIAVLGPDHQFTLRTGNSLAGAHRLRGDLPEAEQIWEQTLAAQRRTLGGDHIDTLGSLNNLGIAYALRGKLSRAEECWRELLDRRRRLLGAESPEYRSSLNNLGMLLLDLGKLEEARPLIEQALAADRQRFGNDHPSTLTSMSNLGELLKNAGELDAAREIQLACIDGYTRTLGPENPGALRAKVGLGTILVKDNQAAYAERILRGVIEAYAQAENADGIDAIDAMSECALALLAQGKNDEAEAMCRDVLRRAKAIIPPTEWNNGQYLSRLGACLAARGDQAGALDALTQGHQLLLNSLGPEHVETRHAAERLRTFNAASEKIQPIGKSSAENTR